MFASDESRRKGWTSLWPSLAASWKRRGVGLQSLKRSWEDGPRSVSASRTRWTPRKSENRPSDRRKKLGSKKEAQTRQNLDALCSLLARSAIVQRDETSWSIDSVWAVLSENARIVLFGGPEDLDTLEVLLGKLTFERMLVSDDASVYHDFSCARECWAHVLRKAIKLTLMDQDNAGVPGGSIPPSSRSRRSAAGGTPTRPASRSCSSR